MSAARAESRRLARSKSEGTLIDVDDDGQLSSNNYKGSYIAPSVSKHSEWPILQPEVLQPAKASNPFWNGLSGSNPFLDDIMDNGESQRNNTRVSILKEDPLAVFGAENADSNSSTDEVNISHLLNLKRKPTQKRSGRWNSASDILDISDGKAPPRQSNLVVSNQFLTPDFDWLKDDREAHKMAWLSHRQLTRSCLDLGIMSQSPGWAQSQATETQIVCKLNHNGGSVQLPDADISAHIPEGHVAPGQIQEIALKAILDPPQGLNTDLSTTLSPLLEVSLSNHDTQECISLEMKIAGEIKRDPLSQVMTEIVCLCGHKKEGPFERLKSCYVYRDTLQVKLKNTRPQLYVIAAAQAKVLQPPAASVWDYMDRQVTVGIYGPKHIHPTFKALCAVFCHNQIPQKFCFSDFKKGGKNLPQVLLQLWGKHQFHPKELQNLQIALTPLDCTYEISAVDQVKEVKQVHLKMGQILRLPFTLSKSGSGEMLPFKLGVQVKGSNSAILTEFTVSTPEAPPRLSDKFRQKRQERRREVAFSAPIPETAMLQCPKFQNREVNVCWYGVALKSVLRQVKVEYLLEYFKGDTIAILSLETIKAVGQTKVKEWHIGFIRGKLGLVHCKNVKVISKEQVIDFTDAKVTTNTLLDQLVRPYKKLTYMYSAIQSLAIEDITSWKAFAEALGYSSLSLEDITRVQVQTEAEKVACVLEKLKEDCHSDKTKKKFQHELMIGLLKIDCQGLVARLTQNTVILSTAVELGIRWRELAERVGKLSGAQIADYEKPHRGKSGEVSGQSMWKPAYDFLYTWSAHYGDSYRDVIQDLHLALDKMKNPITKQWRQVTGALIAVSCMEILRASAFPKEETKS
ncbi:metastasis-associated in colon cancer protein 1 [Lepisosteus oculatus]|uniref:metastasis-associated in colon cancer protein 1 n=1 Tax=Lepisosteus oculatus TaxID=7918 RepID=UPI0035F525C6